MYTCLCVYIFLTRPLVFHSYLWTPFALLRNSQGPEFKNQNGSFTCENDSNKCSHERRTLPARFANLLDRMTREITASFNEPEVNRLQEFHKV